MKLQIDVRGIERTLRTLDRYAKVDGWLNEIALRLCAIGQPIIQATHGHHNHVWREPTENGYKIVAEGESVLFIEFGTGDAAGIHAAEYDAVPSVVRPSSWSETHAHQYERLGFWWWHNTKFTETPPHPSFYDAYQAMVQAIPQIVEEVLR